MNKETIKNLIVENQGRMPFNLCDRKKNIHLKSDQIVTIIGLRRTGKTYFLYQIINKLLEQGTSKEKIIYINFEDERLEFRKETLQLILDSYYEMYPRNIDEKIYLFFDEIQVVDGWELFVRRLHESKKYKIYITGSSSKLLSKEISTSLRGRAISEHIYPLSFSEILEYKGIKISKETKYSKYKYEIKKLLEEYKLWGGFFEIIDAVDTEDKRKIAQSYLDLIIYKDIIDRYSIKNIELLKYLIKYFITNTGNKISLNKIYESIKQKMPSSKDAIANYASFLLDVGFLIDLKKYDPSLKKQNIPSKYYVIDPVFKTIFGHNITTDKGQILENIVLIELYKSEKEIYFSELDEKECDFLIKENNSIIQAIQGLRDKWTGHKFLRK